jgi:hypothetical protein
MDKFHQEINDIRDCMLFASKPYDSSLPRSLTPNDDTSTTSTLNSKPSYAGAVQKVVHDSVKKAVDDSVQL